MSSGFSFNFEVEQKDNENLTEIKDAQLDTFEETFETYPIPAESYYGVITKGHSSLFGPSVAKGTVVEILWETSTHYELNVLLMKYNVDKSIWEYTCEDVFPIRTIFVRLLTNINNTKHTSTPKATLVQNSKPINDDYIVDFDSVFQSPKQLTTMPHYIESPIDVDSSLQSLVWPLGKEEFMNTIFQKRCFVSHSAGSRLQSLHEDFFNFNVKSMLQNASRLVVWMKSIKTGKMQYIDANADIGLNAYDAGHTIYFNPSLDVQEKYIKTLCLDLGCDFGIEKEKGSFGGDLEIFAVNTRHTTSWHFDAQENFSIQLQGTKKWYFVPSDMDEPVTNLHPSSTNRASVASDFSLHRTSTTDFITQQTTLNPTLLERKVRDLDSDPRLRCITVRPGSVFYHPAGMWHKVEAVDDEGSLSINFSLDTLRWSDLLFSRLQQVVVSQTEFRKRIRFNSINLADMQKEAHEQLNSLMVSLIHTLQTLEPKQFFPPALFIDQQPSKRKYISTIESNDTDNQDLSHSVQKKLRKIRKQQEPVDEIVQIQTENENFLPFYLDDTPAVTSLVSLSDTVSSYTMNPLCILTRYDPIKAASNQSDDISELKSIVYVVTSGLTSDNTIHPYRKEIAIVDQYMENITENSLPKDIAQHLFTSVIMFFENLVAHPTTLENTINFNLNDLSKKLSTLCIKHGITLDDETLDKYCNKLAQYIISLLLHVGYLVK